MKKAPKSLKAKSIAILLLTTTVSGASAQEECKSILDDDARLACYDLALGVKEIDEPNITGSGKWNVRTDTSAMTDQKSVYLRLESDDSIRGKYGKPGPATLLLRCRENTTSAFFILNDLFLSDIQGYGNIEYRLDSLKMEKIRTETSTDNKALGLWSGSRAIPFIKKMLNHEKMVIRATPYNDSAVIATFDIRGIDQAISELRETCNW